MRQLCLSADLVPADFLEQIKAGGESSASSGGYAPAVALLSKEQRTALERKLQRAIADQEECPVSFLHR